MKKPIVTACLFCLITGFAGIAQASLESFLTNVNVQARADLNGFAVKLGAQFGVPVPQVQAVIRRVETPADAFMCFELGRMTGRRPETVLTTYSREKGKGWGNIAKSLGIKPGSPEFHALKSGNLSFTGEPQGRDGGHERDKDRGHGKGKGHKK